MAVPRRFLTRRVRNQALPTEADLHRLAYEADLRMIAHLRGNDIYTADNEAKFPAAVAVRNRLGHARWRDLERFRDHMATFCVQSRRLDRERLQATRESLDVFLPHMRAWILSEFGQREVERFEQAHAVRNAGNMAEFRRWFHHNTRLWLVYNQYFEVGDRMDTLQQMQWLLWTLQHPQKPTCMHESSVVTKRALFEVYQTLQIHFEVLLNEFGFGV